MLGAVSWERRRSQYVQSYGFPNILLDGWEGLKAYTFQKRQSKGAQFVTRGEFFSAALRAVQHALPLHFKFVSYAYVIV